MCAYGGSLVEFLGLEQPTLEPGAVWHVQDLVARDVVQIIAGDPKVGKTLIIESLALAMAMGVSDWCGFSVYRPARVLLMPREDSLNTTKQRLWRLARGAGLAGPAQVEGRLEVDGKSPLNLGTPEHVKELAKACKRFDVVFIDSLTTVHTGDENSARDAAKVMESARDFAVSTETAIVLVHHFNGKGNADDRRSVKHRLRGSSAIAGFARHLVGVHGERNGQLLLTTEGNIAPSIKPTLLDLREDTDEAGRSTLAFACVGDAGPSGLADMRARVLRAAAARGSGFTSKSELCKHVSGNRAMCLKAIARELEPDGGLVESNRRICLRSSVPETAENRSEPPIGSGSSPFKGNREPVDQKLSRAKRRDARPAGQGAQHDLV